MHRPDLAAGGPDRVTAHPWLKRLSRAFGASLLLLVLGGAGVAAAADVGQQDFAATGKAITGTKPESKLWYNDGIWWASMWSTSAPAGFYIYRLDTSTETWIKTASALDSRTGSRADTLWDGTHLYVASQVADDDGGDTGNGTSHDARLYRYSYNATSNTYSVNGGYPIVMRAGIQSETLVITKDGTGMLWATWTLQSGAGNLVYTNHTIGGDDTDWSNPVALPFSAAATNLDDISSIIAFSVSGESRVGVFWSNQADDEDYFAWQPAGGSDSDWTLETALEASSGSPKPADDHMNLKTDSSGKVYAVVKTSNTGGSQPLIQLLDRSTGGTWSAHQVGTVTQSNTRAIVELDTSASELHVFLTGRHGTTSGQEGGDIYEKTSPTSSISFTSGTGTLVIRDDDSGDMNNVTSTKQNFNAATGIVVLAYNDTTFTYWHHREAPTASPQPPDANFTGSPTSGPGPLDVTFTNTSTGTAPLTYAWNFGDPGSGGSNTSTVKNPSHTYDDPGTYTVTLTVTNDFGANAQTRTGYITVLTPPDANFTGAPTSGVSPLAVTFANTSTGSAPLTYAWNFGDPSSGSNNTSTLTNPVHTYNPGTYTVTMTATNAAGSNVMTRTNYITVSAPPGSRFQSITPTRVLDTRSNIGLNGVFHANTARTFVVADGTPIPTNAVAVTGNLTVTSQTKGGYVVLAPAAGGATSTLNFPVGDTRANGVTVALGASGTLNATYVAKAGATTHLVFDVTGYFTNGASGSRFHSITPTRVLDSRVNVGLNGVFSANVARTFTVADGTPIPTNAVAVTGNLTVTSQTKGGYVVLAPAAGGATSTLNFPVGDIRANTVTIPLGASGTLSATYRAAAGASAHLIFDVTGYFLAGSSGASFFPLAPQRVLDTRSNIGLNGVFHANTARTFVVADGTPIPTNAVAVTGNLTVTSQTKGGYVVLAPAAGGATSTLNFPVGDTRANGVTVALGASGTLNATYVAKAGATTHLVFDVTGYFR